MGARRPKPTKVKERTSVRPAISLTKLFSAANALVPFKSDEPNQKSQPLSVVQPHGPHQGQMNIDPQDDRTMKLEDPRLRDQQPVHRNEITSISNLERTRATHLRQHDPMAAEALSLPEPTVSKNVAARTSITHLRRQETKRRDDSRSYLALFFLVPAIGLFSYAYFSSTGALHSPPARQSQLTPDQIKERLAFHQQATGMKLNRERIDMQMQNYVQAPELPSTAHKVKPPNMMNGLPLQGESNAFEKRPKDLPYDSTYSEAHIAYGLQEEQYRQEFDRRAKAQWIKEFVDNAAADGYAVKIDDFGNVTTTKIPVEKLGPVEEQPFTEAPGAAH